MDDGDGLENRFSFVLTRVRIPPPPPPFAPGSGYQTISLTDFQPFFAQLLNVNTLEGEAKQHEQQAEDHQVNCYDELLYLHCQPVLRHL